MTFNATSEMKSSLRNVVYLSTERNRRIVREALKMPTSLVVGHCDDVIPAKDPQGGSDGRQFPQ